MQRSKSSAGKQPGGNGPRIAIQQVEEVLAGSGARADALRGAAFATLADVTRAKLVQTRRERTRIAARHGEASERTAALDRKMAVTHRLLVGSRAERDRIDAPRVERDPNGWQVHGYVRNRDGFARAGRTVGLFADEQGGEPLAATTTDERGRFHLRFAPPRDEADAASEIVRAPSKSEAEAEAEAERAREAKRLAAALRRPLYIGTLAPKQSTPTLDARPLHPQAGAIAYRDLVVDEDTDTGGDCHLATRFLGNTSSRELHDLSNEKPACRIAAIRPDHRAYFESEAQAEKLGYDFCAYCFGRGRSRR